MTTAPGDPARTGTQDEQEGGVTSGSQGQPLAVAQGDPARELGFLPLQAPPSASILGATGRLAWLPGTARENSKPARAGAEGQSKASGPSCSTKSLYQGRPPRAWACPQRPGQARQVKADPGPSLLDFVVPSVHTWSTLHCPALSRAYHIQGTFKAPGFLPSLASVHPRLHHPRDMTQGGRCQTVDKRSVSEQ